MTSANHFESITIPPDVQEFESIKYCYHPLLFVKLRNGNIAVASGLGARTLKEIIDPSTEEGCRRLTALMMQAATSRTKSAAEERLEVSSLMALIDLSDLNLEDL
jgi:hypothetical protein